jgi:hypothetical protein
MTVQVWLARLRARSYLVGPWLLLIAFLLPLPFLLGLYPIVRFPQEQIDIHVYPQHVLVEAWYTYRNPFPFPVAQGYALPLPAGPQLPAPTDVWVRRLDSEDEIPLRLFWGTHRFSLAFAARETVTVYAVYRQETPARSAWYILTTTQGWRRPLECGLYRLFPHRVRITSSNYPLQADGPDRLVFERTDFLPIAEWDFAWEVK